MKIKYGIRKIKVGDWVTDKWDRWIYSTATPDIICIYRVRFTRDDICLLQNKDGKKYKHEYRMDNLKIIIPKKGSKYRKR